MVFNFVPKHIAVDLQQILVAINNNYIWEAEHLNK